MNVEQYELLLAYLYFDISCCHVLLKQEKDVMGKSAFFVLHIAIFAWHVSKHCSPREQSGMNLGFIRTFRYSSFLSGDQ